MMLREITDSIADMLAQHGLIGEDGTEIIAHIPLSGCTVLVLVEFDDITPPHPSIAERRAIAEHMRYLRIAQVMNTPVIGPGVRVGTAYSMVPADG